MKFAVLRGILVGTCAWGISLAAQAQGGPSSAQPDDASTRAAREAELADQRAITTKLERLRRAEPEPKIVNGIPAAPGRWPFGAAIGQPLSGGRLFQYCGGTLISDQWVLTAAHCDVQKSDKIILGRLDLTSGGGEVIGVAEVIQHPAYNARTHDSDAAIIRLERPSKQRPVVLVDQNDSQVQPGRRVTPIGWGLTREAGGASNVLMQVDIPIIDSDSCAAMYEGTSVEITDQMLCAGSLGKDTCQGDSGGGLFVVDPQNGEDQIAGIVSFGIGCARQNYLGVYTRVSRMLGWVEQKTGVKPSAASPNTK